MACTESNWACEPSSIIDLQPNFADCLCRSDGRPCRQDGQAIDAQSAGTAPRGEKYCKITRFQGQSWQDSFGFQEFGFSYNIVEPPEVAPADELFYKGQILPLQTDTRLHVVQALSTCFVREREQLSEVTRHAGRPSSVNGDDEVKFSSCRIEGAMYDKATNSSASGAMRSVSFRSQHSGYWESGGEKETTDTSSSSRDSNGSSQDSYIPSGNSMSHINFKVKPTLIPWKSFFGGLMRVSRRQHNHPPSLPVVAFSEDLSKYRHAAELPFSEAKVGLAPLMPDKDVGQGGAARQERAGFKSKFATNQHRSNGRLKGKCVLSNGPGVENGVFKRKYDLKGGVEDGKSKSKSGLQDEELQKSTPQYCREGSSGTTKVKFPRFNKGRLKSKCTNKDATSKDANTAVASRDAEGQKQRRGAVKERWQGYARKLKPLYEVKKGLMGQFRMDECGKNACEVESGIVRRPSLQRRLSHQSSLFKNHMEHEENGASPCIATSNNNMQMAMSSCPPSTRSSPNHSGVLAVVVDNKPKLYQSGGKPNHTSTPSTTKKVVSNESISVSTMHELHSAVQSAIAHCKESNKRYHLD